MSHHGQDPFEEEKKALQERLSQSEKDANRNALTRRLLDTTGFKGATGMFPEGQLTPDDEGQIRFFMKSENGKVVIDFGKSVAWVGMTPQEACDLAGDLVKFARAVARKNGEMVALTIK